MNRYELCWLAGLLEGEGCFDLKNPMPGAGRPSARIRVKMTDLDVIERVSKMWDRSLTKQKNGNFRDVYYTQIQGLPALNLMMKLRPYMGTRRQSKIDEIVAAYVDR